MRSLLKQTLKLSTSRQTKKSSWNSVVDPGCLSRIQKHQQKRGVKKNVVVIPFCSHKFHKTENYFIFEMPKKNFGPVFKEF
jgi:hypothetical protein